jgi:phage major head subunit gpT-like protein
MAQITAALLGSINNGLQMAYNTQFYAVASKYKKICFDATSTGAAEVYPRLDMLPGVREFIGPRVVHNPTQESFTITNRTFEETIGIKRSDVEDDKYGMYSVVAGQMGMDAGQVPDKLVAQIVKASLTTNTYDGQPFFSTAHPTYDANGNPTTVSNYAAGSGGNTSAGWWLIDNTKMLKPWIFQKRVPFELVTRFNPEDPSVFDSDEFLWGTRGRCNAGLGLWQFAYYSTQSLNVANLVAARTAMAEIRRPDGTPMGIKPNLLMTGSGLYPLVKSYYENGLIGSDPTTPTTLVQNQIIGMFEPFENEWLN